MRDYLSAYIHQTLIHAIPQQVPEVPEVGFVTSGTSRGRRPRQETGGQKPFLTAQNLYSYRVPKVPKHVHKTKVWRREPYYPPCLAATMLEGKTQRRAADELFVALALIDGHEPDEVVGMLRRLSPSVTSTANYYREVVERVGADSSVVLTEDCLNLYTTHHPFARELQLSNTLKRGSANEQIS